MFIPFARRCESRTLPEPVLPLQPSIGSGAVEHVVIRPLEHLRGTAAAPSLGFAVETRDRPGPAYKEGTSPDDVVWVQLHGGLFVGRARIEIGWVGEYSNIH